MGARAPGAHRGAGDRGLLGGAVLAAVHHAEVVAHRVGELVWLAGARGGRHRD